LVGGIEPAGEALVVSPNKGPEGGLAPSGVTAGARKRAAVETYVHHEAALRRTARRYSLCSDDADDALQRGLEILLRKAPSEDPRELIRWTQTVVKHEALAVRRERERILSGPAAARPDPDREDWVALLPSEGAGPSERAERHEAIARSREALQALKPQELRALTLLAEGYSYAEIGAITGYSQTKINRCLAEGRERFRRLFARSEDGARCGDLRPLLSAFADGEASAEEAGAVREHLRACAGCRVTLRAYRAAPGAAAALAPALPLSRSLFERAHDAVTGLAARFGGGGGGDTTISQVAASGGARGAGVAALAKAAAICAGTAGGAAACVAAGVVPAPLAVGGEHEKAPAIERKLDRVAIAEWDHESGPIYEDAPATPDPSASPPVAADPAPASKQVPAAAEALPAAPATASGAVEYAPEPAPAAPAPSPAAAPSSGSAAGEFGP
jgi:RNA polymerase sigma factor (sigma-70 family)